MMTPYKTQLVEIVLMIRQIFMQVFDRMKEKRYLSHGFKHRLLFFFIC